MARGRRSHRARRRRARPLSCSRPGRRRVASTTLRMNCLPVGDVCGWAVTVCVGRVLDEVRVDEGDAWERPRGCAGEESVLGVVGGEDVGVVERVALIEAQGAVAVLEVSPADRFAAVGMRRIREVVEDGRGEDGQDRARVVELPEAARVEVESAGQEVEAVAEGRAGMARKPAVPDREVAGERIVGGNRCGGLVAHDLAGDRAAVGLAEAGGEAVHAPAVDRVRDGFAAVRRVGREQGVGERVRGVVGSEVGVGLAALQPVDVTPPQAASACRQAEVAEHMVKGAVLHHQDDDVVDVGQVAGAEVVSSRPIRRRLRYEDLRGGLVDDRQVLVINRDRVDHDVVAVGVAAVVGDAAGQP